MSHSSLSHARRPAWPPWPLRPRPWPAPLRRPPAPLYKDPAPPVDLRVADLLSRMTLEEKVAQLITLSRTSGRDGRRAEFAPARRRRLSQRHRPGRAAVGPRRAASRAAGHAAAGADRARSPAPTRPPSSSTPRRSGRARTPGSASRSCSTRKRCTGMAPGGDQLPAGDRPGQHLGPGPAERVFAVIAPRGARARHAAGALAGGRRRPRPALGPHRGDLRRGPVPVRARWALAAVRGLQGDGTDARAGQGVRHAQAHDRARPAASPATTSARRRSASATLREVFFPPFERGGRSAPASRAVDAVVQRDRRRPLATPTAGCSATCCAASGASTGAIVSDYAAVEELVDLPQAGRRPRRRGAAGAATPASTSSCPTARPIASCVEQVQAGRIPMALVDDAVRAHAAR